MAKLLGRKRRTHSARMGLLPAGATLISAIEGRDDALAVAVADGKKGGVRLSRAQLRAAVGSLAKRLVAAGVKPGDVVSMVQTNTVEFLVSFLAVGQARGVAAPFNSAYKQDEFSWYMEDATTKLLLLPPEGNDRAAAAAEGLAIPAATLELVAPAAPGAAPGLRVVEVAAGKAGPRVTSAAAEAAAESDAAPPAPEPSDVALFLHTSGTTSKPKGVPLSHANLAASMANIVATYDLGPSDVSYMVMPLFHVHGLLAGTLAPLAAGGAIVLPVAGRFSASVFWEDCARHGATFYTAVPTMHQVLLERAPKDFPKDSPPPLRFIRSCSSSLAPATHAALEETFGVPVLEAYAMTEAAHQMTSNPLPARGPRKAGSVGKAQGGVSVAILDDAGALLPQGEVGEVCIKGANVTKGYINNPKANAEAFTAEGWFRTGDQGRLDEEGYLFLTGRLKELINRGGEKISPLEVDGVLLSHPAVSEAVSFGAPDPKYGEVVAAAVVLREGEEGGEELVEAIRAHCAKQLSAFKVPGPGLLFVTDALPKGATGKVQRRHMPAAFLGTQ
ncbi:hypothetical protein Rsub_09996 [Raphidocelis subcapitata]|uniref:Uncharacterized protein n=1 Tax=Raphidocelis subcapitata TaxID=307507 RepID=A0A2V0PJT5_9CHLO|nr:hypothetical protein Rsub_09996 [Raphidocelis subcapitata]|eukprot:GBF97305.1 hypothetical protein Rsub_09996 [Raphidocelis subcapitata]